MTGTTFNLLHLINMLLQDVIRCQMAFRGLLDTALLDLQNEPLLVIYQTCPKIGQDFPCDRKFKEYRDVQVHQRLALVGLAL